MEGASSTCFRLRARGACLAWSQANAFFSRRHAVVLPKPCRPGARGFQTPASLPYALAAGRLTVPLRSAEDPHNPRPVPPDRRPPQEAASAAGAASQRAGPEPQRSAPSRAFSTPLSQVASFRRGVAGVDQLRHRWPRARGSPARAAAAARASNGGERTGAPRAPSGRAPRSPARRRGPPRPTARARGRSQDAVGEVEELGRELVARRELARASVSPLDASGGAERLGVLVGGLERAASPFVPTSSYAETSRGAEAAT